MQLGFTGVAAQNGDSNLTSNLLGVDFRFTIRPPEAGTRKDLTLRTEGYRLQRLSDAPTTTRYGMYSDLTWRFSQRWVVGGRYDYVEAPFGPEDNLWRADRGGHLVAERIRVPAPAGLPQRPRIHRPARQPDAPGRLGARSP